MCINPEIIAKMGTYTDSGRIINALGYRQKMGFLIQYFEQFIFIFLAIWMKNKFVLINESVKDSDLTVKDMTVYNSKSFSLACIVFLPFYLISSNFQRYITMQVPIYYCAYSVMFDILPPKSRTKYKFIIAVVVITAFMYYINIRGVSNLVEYITKNNMFLIGN